MCSARWVPSPVCALHFLEPLFFVSVKQGWLKEVTYIKHTTRCLAWSKQPLPDGGIYLKVWYGKLFVCLCICLTPPLCIGLPSLLTTGDIEYQWKIHPLVNILWLAFYTVCRIQSIMYVIRLYIAFSMNKKWGDGILFSAVSCHETRHRMQISAPWLKGGCR